MGTTASKQQGEARLGPESLGEALRMLRHRTKTSRDQLAVAANVSAGAISNYENDVSTPSAPTLRKVTHALADLLGIEPARLWEELGKIMDEVASEL